MTNPDLKTVAVVGATGAVGEVVLRLLAERNFPVGELRALAFWMDQVVRQRAVQAGAAAV